MARHTSAGGSVNVQNDKVDAFGERIALAIERAGGAKKMAEKTGMSTSVLRSWRSEKSDPSRASIVKVARAAGVSIEWLAAGEGPMESMAEEEGGDALDDEPQRKEAYTRRSESLSEERNRSGEIREIKPTPVKVREGREPENRTAQVSEAPDDSAAVPFITALSVAISGPARRHSEGALDEKDKRLWVTMKAYSTLWNLYQQREDVLNRLTEEDVDPVVQGVAHAYDLLHWPKGEAGDDWFY
ncbi:MAG: helix-turn-helix domain-containing protein [Thiohalospira sp.]